MKRSLWITVVLLLGGADFALLRYQNARPPDPQAQAALATVIRRENGCEIVFAGTVLAGQSMEIRALGAGQVTRLGGAVGDTMPRGTPLVELDSSAATENLLAAQRALKDAQEQMARIHQDLSDVRTRIRRIAEQTSRRRGTRPPSERDRAIEARLDKQLDTARNRVLAAENRVTQAQTVLRNLVVNAPVDGRILSWDVHTGQYVRAMSDTGPGTLLLRFSATAAVPVEARVQDAIRPLLQTNQSALVKAEQGSGESFTGRITSIQEPLPENGADIPVRVQIEVDDPRILALRQGSHVRVTVRTTAEAPH